MATKISVFVAGIAFLFVFEMVTSLPQPTVKFSYMGKLGPPNWGTLSSDYSTCSSGKIQSPIDIVTPNAIWNSDLAALTRNYIDANATLVNNGFNIALRWDDVGALVVGGKNYIFKQMHWHTPSEHLLDGVRYPMELHLVHESADGEISVVSILYQFGDPDPFLYQVKSVMEELAKEVCAGDEEAHITVGRLSTKALRRSTRKYFRYVGSLSSPPCTEQVTWSILGKVREMSKRQLTLLHRPLTVEYHNNSRPIQPLNGRHVDLYDEMRLN